MATPTTDDEWVAELARRHDRELPELRDLDSYYEGTQPLSYMQPEILREVGDRIRPVIIAWPQLVVDAVEERLDVEGFRLPDQDEIDEDLWRVWQANNLDEEGQLGRVDALVMKRSYLTVGTNEDDEATPLITAESPLDMYALIDPRTRRVRAALRRTQETDAFDRVTERYATLYLPDRTVWYEWHKGAWRESSRDDHKLGEVPVVPLTNRSRLADRYGRSELSRSMLSLSDSANKLATDMMLAAEFVALPLRGLLGIGPDDLVDADGNALSATQVILGKFLTVRGDDANEVKPFEWSPASLNNFHDSINQLAKLVASISGIPPHYLGFTTDNPASADAIRSAESRLVKRAERKQVAFGGAYEQTMRLVRRFQTGGEPVDPRLRQLETVWRDASTPTRAQSADAVVKLLEKGAITKRQAREDLRYTKTQIERMEREDLEEQVLDPVGVLSREVGQRVGGE